MLLEKCLKCFVFELSSRIGLFTSGFPPCLSIFVNAATNADPVFVFMATAHACLDRTSMHVSMHSYPRFQWLRLGKSQRSRCHCSSRPLTNTWKRFASRFMKGVARLVAVTSEVLVIILFQRYP